MAMNEGGRHVVKIWEGRLGSPELAMPAVLGLGGDGRVVDGARGVKS
jgi:hypothetical protein